MVFILHFTNIVYHTDRFADVKKSFHPWDKFHLIKVYDPFNILLDSVWWYFVENFASTFISDTDLVFSFCVCDILD